MSGYLSLVQKEWRESLKTYRALIAAAVFLFAGISGPLLAHFLPELLRNSSNSSIHVTIEPQTAVDALLNYASNVAQIPTLVVILLAMGTVAEERAHGFGAVVLSRPISRSAYVLAKFSVHALLLLGTLCLGAAAAFYYTVLLFSGAQAGPFLLLNLGIAVTLLDVLAITVLCSSLLRSGVAAGGTAFVVYLLCTNLPNFWPSVRDRLPWGVSAHTREVLMGTWGGGNLVWPLLSGMLIAAACLVAACLMMRRLEV